MTDTSEPTGTGEPTGTASASITLESIPLDDLTLIALKLDIPSLGRLACSSTSLCKAVTAATEVWENMWEMTTSSASPAGIASRDALQSLFSLNGLRWEKLSSSAAPPWREFPCVLSHGGNLILCAGRFFDEHGDDTYFNDAWVFDTKSGLWHQVATDSPRAPQKRCFNSDGGGGGCVIRSHGEEWAAFFGGKRVEGYRDHETWLLGPLNAELKTWKWVPVRPDFEVAPPPQPRFHHTLTVVPDPNQEHPDDFIVIFGGHNRIMSPIVDLHVFTLRDASFDWLSEAMDVDESKDFRVSATAAWVPQPRDSEPMPRGFHCATFWQPQDTALAADEPGGFLVVSCGLGFEPEGDGEEPEPPFGAQPAVLGDVWLYSTSSSQWSQLPSELPESARRSRAAASIVRDCLVLSGGCGLPEGEHWLSPGVPFHDIWVLNLADAYLRTPALWERCTLPSDHVARPKHTQATACPMFGGAALLIFGGFDPSRRPGMTDNFGDPHSGQAWAAHESLVLSFTNRTPTSPRAAALCTAGMPDSQVADRSEEADCPAWVPRERGARVLVHGLSGAPELNGTVGTVVDLGKTSRHPDERLGVKIGVPHNKAVKVRRRNLWPSEAETQPLLATPDAWTDEAAAHQDQYVLLPSITAGRTHAGGHFGGASSVSWIPDDPKDIRVVPVRLSLLPDRLSR